MTCQVRELAAKPDDLGSIPGTYTVEGENQLPQSDLHTCTLAHKCTHRETETERQTDTQRELIN